MSASERFSGCGKTIVVLFCATTFALLTACASSGPKPLATPLTKIMVLPVMPVDKLHTENKGVPVGVLWQAIADRSKSAAFTQSMETTRNTMARDLTTALLKDLNGSGFDAQLLQGVERPAASPDDIDYPKLPSANPVLHVYFEEVGMYSSRFSLDYIPRVNVTAYLVRPKNEESIYSETIYYGADAGSKVSRSIPGDPKYKWPSFDALIQQPKEVSDAYGAAVTAISSKIAVNLRAMAPSEKN